MSTGFGPWPAYTGLPAGLTCRAEAEDQRTSEPTATLPACNLRPRTNRVFMGISSVTTAAGLPQARGSNANRRASPVAAVRLAIDGDGSRLAPTRNGRSVTGECQLPATASPMWSRSQELG